MLYPLFSRSAAVVSVAVALAAMDPLSQTATAVTVSPFRGTLKGTFGNSATTFKGSYSGTIDSTGKITGKAHEERTSSDATLLGTITDKGALNLTGKSPIGTLTFKGQAKLRANNPTIADVTGTYTVKTIFGTVGPNPTSATINLLKLLPTPKPTATATPKPTATATPKPTVRPTVTATPKPTVRPTRKPIG